MRLSERDMLRTVIDAARLKGWLVAHFRPALTQRGTWITAVQGDGKGFPDLVLAHPKRGKILYVELKSERGKLSVEQTRWLDVLSRAGGETRVIYPHNLGDFLHEL